MKNGNKVEPIFFFVFEENQFLDELGEEPFNDEYVKFVKLHHRILIFYRVFSDKNTQVLIKIPHFNL